MNEQANMYLAQGIRLAREGQKDRAAPYLARTVQINPRSEPGWLWLAACMTDIDQQRYCLGRALQINPNNMRVRQALERLNRTTWPAGQQPSHLETTQPVRQTSSVPVTSGAMVYDLPASPQTSAGRVREEIAPAAAASLSPTQTGRRPSRQAQSPSNEITKRLNRLNGIQIALMILGVLLAFLGLLYFLWTILAPGVAPRDLPPVAFSLLPGRARIAPADKNLAEVIAAASAGATIRLTPGVYRLEAPLALTRPITLTGAGMDLTQIVSDQPGPVVLIQGVGPFVIDGVELQHNGRAPADVLVVEGGAVKISNCRVVGGVYDAATQSGGRGIVLNAASTGSIDTCEVLDHETHGIEIGSIATISLRYSTVHDNLGSGVVVSGQSQPLLEENILSRNGTAGLTYSEQAGGKAIHNETSENKGSGIEILGSAAPVLLENASTENREYGVRIAGEARPVLLDNRVSRNSKAGLAFFDRSAGAVEKNECSENNLHGISVNDSAEPYLAGNLCNRNQQVGIDYWGAAGGVARDNECADNGYQGIAVHESASPVLEQNRCNHNGDSGIIYWGDSGGQASANQCSENGVNGIAIHGNAMPFLQGNRCDGNVEAGMMYYDQSRGVARGNTCTNNGSDRIGISESAAPQLEENACLE